MRISRSTRRRALTAGAAVAGTVGVLGYRTARYRHESAIPYRAEDVPPPGSREFSHLMQTLTGSGQRQGNAVEVLRNGCRIFPAMLSAIEQAQHTIDFATYVYWTGSIAPRFAEALAARARAGVDVNVLLDAVGAARMDRSLVDEMTDAGATVAWFRPPRWHTVPKLDHRTHRRILVVDGQVGFTGGVGIAEQWTGDCEDPDHWRDTHLRIVGPAVTDLLSGFQENWAEATHHILTGPRLREPDEQPDGVGAQVVRSTAGLGSAAMARLCFAALEGARRSVSITTAYFAPGPGFLEALERAAARGVDVRVLVNGSHTNREVVRQAGRDSYAQLLEAGVRVFEYERTLLHAKTLTVDGRWALVGTMNFDDRSMLLNDEIAVAVADDDMCATLDEHFARDLEDARKIRQEAWERRPAAPRLLERLSAAARHEL